MTNKVIQKKRVIFIKSCNYHLCSVLVQKNPLHIDTTDKEVQGCYISDSFREQFSVLGVKQSRCHSLCIVLTPLFIPTLYLHSRAKTGFKINKLRLQVTLTLTEFPD